MAGLEEAGFGYIESRAIKKSKDAEAAQIRKAAIARKAAGAEDAYLQRKLGDRVASDALAAMAAGGGQVEAPVLADIKSITDYNVLASMFAAEAETREMDYAARTIKFEGKQQKRLATEKLAREAIKTVVSMGTGGGMGGGGNLGGNLGGMGSFGDYANFGKARALKE